MTIAFHFSSVIRTRANQIAQVRFPGRGDFDSVHADAWSGLSTQHTALMCAAWQPLPNDLPVKRGASEELCTAMFFFCLFVSFPAVDAPVLDEQKQKQQKP